jgi:UDPglucose 6-dehydrogenase
MAAAGFAKYTINSFLATKVTFFNEIRSLYDALSIEGDYTNVLKAITADPRIGRSHTEAPGPDGEYGWGGACFPKDTSEFVDLASRFDSPLNLLECAIELNREHRVKNK